MSGGRIWRLCQGSEVIGEIDFDKADWPWMYGPFFAREGFAAVAPLFTRELALIEDETDTGSALWGEIYRQIWDRCELVDPDGRSIPEFLLHIDGDVADLRMDSLHTDPDGSA